MKKLDYKTYCLRRLFDYIGVIFLIMLLMFIWQLYRGEISIPFLKPYIIKALNHDDNEYMTSHCLQLSIEWRESQALHSNHRKTH